MLFANREFVLVALVEVPLVKVRSPKPLIPEKVLLSERRVEDALVEGRQMEAIAKQPAVRFIPFAKVEEDVSEVALKMLADSPPANVLVP